MTKLLCPALLLLSTALTVRASPLRRQLDWSDQSWDAIVVGAGPAGIILADRLSEAGKSTLLLEQGGPSYAITGGTAKPAWLQGTDLTRVDVPGLYSSIFGANQDGLTCGDKLGAFGGCTVGGGSAINAGLQFEPPASDFDTFFPDGWKSSDVQPAIARLKSRQESAAFLAVNNQPHAQAAFEATRKWLVGGTGFHDTDFMANPDDKTNAFGRPVFDYAGGQRGGPVRTYLQTALARANFHLQINTQVKHIARNGGQATGVVASVNGADKTISLAPTGRVILAGGALFSPQLLMLSGIGDPAVLARVQQAGRTGDASTWINNTAVGLGLFDNPNTFIELSSPDVSSYTYSYDNPIAADRDLYLHNRTGPYAYASEAAAFWDTVTRPDGSRAGMQGTVSVTGYGDFKGANDITLNIYGTSGLFSTGAVELDDNLVPGPSDQTYYSNPQDAQDIATFIRKVFDGLPTSTLTPLNLKQDASHDEIVSYITTPSTYARGEVNHFSSSCRIGACVDVNTQVMGTANMHVVDASILAPLTVNPQMGVMIAAERASELILRL